MSSHIVWRDEKDENGIISRKRRVTNQIIDGDVLATPEEIAAWYADADKKELIRSLKAQLTELDIKRVRAVIEGGTDKDGILFLDKYNRQVTDIRQQLKNLE